jgi:hypothetical protein
MYPHPRTATRQATIAMLLRSGLLVGPTRPVSPQADNWELRQLAHGSWLVARGGLVARGAMGAGT